MSVPEVYTYYDAIQAVRELARAYGSGGRNEMLYSIVQRAYRRITNDHDWRFLVTQGRIQLQAAVTDSTITYDHTGGTYERQLTLASGSWASDIQDWTIRIGNVNCEVERRWSDTVLQLDAILSPNADVAAGTSYTAFKQWYALPNDFDEILGAMSETSCLRGVYLTPTQMAEMNRWEFGTGDVYYYTIMSAPGIYGTQALFVYNPVSTAETYDFIYRRKPRQLRYTGERTADSAGTIAVTADSTTVTGTDTSFDVNNHPGSLILIGDSATAPTGWEGDTPYMEKRAIRTVASTASLTLDGNIVTTNSGIGYRITDPIDLPAYCQNAFHACCEAELARLARMKPDERNALEGAYQRELSKAKCADSPITQRRVIGETGMPAVRLAVLANGGTPEA